MGVRAKRLQARVGRFWRGVTNGYRWQSRVDRFVEVVAPKRAFLRNQARKAMAMTHRDGPFAGAQPGLNNTIWNADDGSIDEQLLDKLPELRRRVRELESNDAHAAAVKSAYVEGVVGTGICPKPAPNREVLLEAGLSDEEIDRVVAQLDTTWNEWVPHADASGRLDFYQLQAQAEGRKVSDGEVFVKLSMLSREQFPERPSELAIELIVADRVDTPINLKQSRERTRAGIQIDDRTGRPLRAWVRVGHPGDRRYGAARKSIQYRACRFRDGDGRRSFLQLFDQHFPGQTRGYPLLTPVLPLFQLFSDTLRAECLAIKTQACFAGYIIKKDPGLFTKSMDAAKSRTEAGNIKSRIEPASLIALEEGEDVKFGNPTRPGGTFEPYIFRMLKTLGAGTGLSYEAVSRDWTNTTYTSGRMAEIAQRRTFKCRRAANVAGFYKPVRDFLIEEAWLAGRIDIPQFRELRSAWLACEWQAKLGDIWVDPLKDAKAIREELDMGLTSRRMECVARGRDPDAILRDQKMDEEAEREILGREPIEPPDPNAVPQVDDVDLELEAADDVVPAQPEAVPA